jgi:hypothetical protein
LAKYLRLLCLGCLTTKPGGADKSSIQDWRRWREF